LFTTRFGFVMCVGSLVIATQGMERGRKLLFPLLFLFLMIPLPYIVYYKLTFPLQLLSSRIAADTLAMMGMPVVRSGNVIYLEHYTLEVVTACSGLRSIMTLGTMSVFLTDMFRFGILRKMILVFCVIPIAIIANTVRLILTAVVSAVASPEVADSFLHDLSGIVLFMIGLLALLLVGRMLEWKPEQQGS